MKHPQDHSSNEIFTLIGGILLTGLGIYLLLDIVFGIISLLVGSYLLWIYYNKTK